MCKDLVIIIKGSVLGFLSEGSTILIQLPSLAEQKTKMGLLELLLAPPCKNTTRSDNQVVKIKQNSSDTHALIDIVLLTQSSRTMYHLKFRRGLLCNASDCVLPMGHPNTILLSINILCQFKQRHER